MLLKHKKLFETRDTNKVRVKGHKLQFLERFLMFLVPRIELSCIEYQLPHNFDQNSKVLSYPSSHIHNSNIQKMFHVFTNHDRVDRGYDKEDCFSIINCHLF